MDIWLVQKRQAIQSKAADTMTRSSKLLLSLTTLFFVTACSGPDSVEPTPADSPEISVEMAEVVTEQTDLVSGGLGLAGLRAPRLEPQDPAAPTPEELRTMAFHTQFNGLSAINRPDGLGSFSSDGLPVVAGLEIMTRLPVGDTNHTSRALLQIPDSFNPQTPCLVVAPASGSRGVYGAVPLVAPWALPKGCAVVYTDKGAGTDYFDVSRRTGVQLDGTRTPLAPDNATDLGFVPAMGDSSTETANAPMAIPHAHSGINIEAGWGEITLAATEWAIARLAQAFDDFAPEQLITVAAGLSNGGQAVLQALEKDAQGHLDAVVAIMPNIATHNAPSLYEYAAMAARFQPCALGDPEFASTLPFANPLLIGFGPNRCQSLHEAGLINEPTPQAAMNALMDFGFDAESLAFSAATVALDLWRTVLVNSASAYMQTPFDDMPCGYGFDASQSTESQQNTWWATGSGSPPGDGIVLVDANVTERPTDPHFTGLQCLAELLNEATLHEAIDATRAKAQWPNEIPVFIVHGQHDALIPAVFSSRAYVAEAQAAGMEVNYLEIPGAQHFDAFLNALPMTHDNGPDWVPILPHGWAALDRAWEAINDQREAN